ncbi:hypothetical protein VUR80DRAFT_9127 [Thermomyces stellatus]
MGTVGKSTLELTRSTTGLLRGVKSWGQCASLGISSRQGARAYPALLLRGMVKTYDDGRDSAVEEVRVEPAADGKKNEEPQA